MPAAAFGRVLSLVALILLTIALPGVAFADTPAATTLTLSAGKTTPFGQSMHLSARLVDAAGAPIGGVQIAFVVPGVFFLGATSDVRIAEVMTDKDGVAQAEYEPRDAGWLDVQAQFRGNDHYAASRASAQVLVDGTPDQLYVQHAGVQIPGLDLPPNQQPALATAEGGATSPATGLASFWPALSAWPLAVVLLIIWSLYAIAVSQMFRIASAPAGKPVASDGHGGGHWIIAGGSDENVEGNGGPDLPMKGEDR